ncbi:MAG: hypothetical protein RLY86_748 [Pseudomonadota bacterium]|jgi:hypothetical protein
MTEQEQFIARFNKMRADGLVDIKFFVNPEGDVSVESFFGSLNRIFDAVDGGRCRRHLTWDEDYVPEGKA